MVFTIDEHGDVQVKTDGFKGDSCDVAMKPFERSLGKVTNRKHTNEFYEKGKVSGRNYTTGK